MMFKLLYSTLFLSLFSRKIQIKTFFTVSSKLFTKANKEKYLINKNKYFDTTEDEIVSLNINYVYFALANQPEATTLAFGDEYDDQLLAIEKISSKIPDDWRIVVKEHPYQFEHIYRAELFFKRLKSIKSVILLKQNITEVKLREKAKFIATVSGNTGWECIRINKPVLIFGRPWYLTFPGIMYIKDWEDVDQIMKLSWDLDDIKNHMIKLSKKMGDGLITLDYKNSKDFFNNFETTEYNTTDNIKKLIKSFKKICESDKMVWF